MFLIPRILIKTIDISYGKTVMLIGYVNVRVDITESASC